MMKLLFASTILGLLCSSCVSLMNTSHTRFSVHSNQPMSVVHEGDTMRSRLTSGNNYSVVFYPPRQKQDLQLSVHSDSLNSEISIPSKLDGKIYANIFFPLGVGLIVDFNSKKRFTYPQDIFIDSLTPVDYKYIKPRDVRPKQLIARKGTFTLNIGFPYVNIFAHNSPYLGKTTHSTGFMGFSIGSDYYYHDNRFFNLTVAGVMDFMVPFPAPVCYDDEGVHEHFASTYGQFTHNHRVGEFSFGYGAALAANWWRREEGQYIQNGDSYYSIDTVESDLSLGLAANAYFVPNESFYVGVNYRPTFISLQSDVRSSYNHVISIDFGFKIRLNK